jgi:hypothetical protein
MQWSLFVRSEGSLLNRQSIVGTGAPSSQPSIIPTSAAVIETVSAAVIKTIIFAFGLPSAVPLVLLQATVHHWSCLLGAVFKSFFQAVFESIFQAVFKSFFQEAVFESFFQAQEAFSLPSLSPSGAPSFEPSMMPSQQQSFMPSSKHSSILLQKQRHIIRPIYDDAGWKATFESVFGAVAKSQRRCIDCAIYDTFSVSIYPTIQKAIHSA